MNTKLTANDAQEVAHKLGVMADSPDLLNDYGISAQQADALRCSVPVSGGSWEVPPFAEQAVREEMQDHCTVLNGIASDARAANEKGQALRISKQANRLREIFA